MLKSYKIIITGQVQGVGFRPFVFVLAQKYNLKGTVSNNEEGVIIYVSGSKNNILGVSKYNSDILSVSMILSDGNLAISCTSFRFT